MFKSKHKLDLGIVSFDPRGREVLGLSDSDVSGLGVYDIVHPDDLAYVASAHGECKYRIGPVGIRPQAGLEPTADAGG